MSSFLQGLSWNITKKVFGSINISTPNALRYLVGRFGYKKDVGYLASYLLDIGDNPDFKLLIKLHVDITIFELLISEKYYSFLYQKYKGNYEYPRDFEIKSPEMKHIGLIFENMLQDFKNNPVEYRDSYFTIVGNFDFKKGINSVKIYECIL